MDKKIQVLDEQTINQIAAGEVVENPASVVKELAENSLDAGATEITAEIRAGGRQLIRITDNGAGMSGEDALLSLERHATSKIRGIEDLYDVYTMGFRGEAVPSIASISKLTILTRSVEEKKGTLIYVEGGKLLKNCPVERDPGTTMEVDSLFFNVPVRKKFQRSPTYDSNEVLKVLSMLALTRPDVKFTLISQGKTLLKATQGDFKRRIEEVLGKEFSCGLCPLSFEKEGIKLEGFVGLPYYNRHNRTGQYLFINGRAVFSPLISFAVKEGYGTAMGTHRYPVFVLRLSIPGSLVDVNVHPQKKEVRLRQEQQFKQLIAEAVEKALSHEILPETTVETPLPFTYSPSLASLPDKVSIEERFYTTEDSAIDFKEWMIREAESEPVETSKTAPLFPQESADAPPSVLATVPGFILVQTSKEKLYWVSARNAHARVLYEALDKNYLPATQIQQLLIPLNFDFSPIEAAAIREHLEILEKWGLGIKEFGRNSFAIDAIPRLWDETKLEDLLHSIAKEAAETSKPERKLFVQTVVNSAFAKDQMLSQAQAQALINQLHQSKNHRFCPLGKPTAAEILEEEIAKLFQT
ncbi:DNA mismatch repair endonuclease MutL [Waddlia chondrophila]|uniref:DNA mismatch repair protein MutL n=1 Tax=Waddlia chondrophila (strain ATCC VR-1470 / WSU 86-1044) TaxID=716544 RepID=D6YT11_WADCW|nr:DNA mismatch repair endonuclease MutL [Waddlia chondrophila]ADI39206.1 putative DNA mismatch repair protein mutL [Waddlia chondrophila WSU 86-1044]